MVCAGEGTYPMRGQTTNQYKSAVLYYQSKGPYICPFLAPHNVSHTIHLVSVHLHPRPVLGPEGGGSSMMPAHFQL